MESLVIWCKLQLVLSAVFQWLFIPVTIGTAILMAVQATVGLKKNDAVLIKSSAFWGRIFGISLAAEIITAVVLGVAFRISFATSFSLSPEVFGAPLVFEGIAGFIIAAVAAALLYFKGSEFSPKQNIATCWAAVVGAVLSMHWAVVVTSWMQHPVGVEFDLDTASCSIVDLSSVLFNTFVQNRFFHIFFASVLLVGVAVVGFCCFNAIKGCKAEFVKKNMMAGIVAGVIGLVGVTVSGCLSAGDVAYCQPMQYAAMNNIKGAGTSAVPGIEALQKGCEEKIKSGMKAARSAILYNLRKEQFPEFAEEVKAEFEKENKYLGYGYLIHTSDAVPSVNAVSASYTLMKVFGIFAMVILLVVAFFFYKNALSDKKWLNILALASVPVLWLSIIFGSLSAELGRFPWVIYELYPFTSDLRGEPSGSIATCIISILLLLATLFFAVKFTRKAINAEKE